jgi:hypothetical protein
LVQAVQKTEVVVLIHPSVVLSPHLAVARLDGTQTQQTLLAAAVAVAAVVVRQTRLLQMEPLEQADKETLAAMAQIQTHKQTERVAVVVALERLAVTHQLLHLLLLLERAGQVKHLQFQVLLLLMLVEAVEALSQTLMAFLVEPLVLAVAALEPYFK